MTQHVIDFGSDARAEAAHGRIVDPDLCGQNGGGPWALTRC